MLVMRPVKLGARRVLGFHAVPGIGLKLLHAERNALRIRVDLDDLHLHRVADGEHLARDALTRFQLMSVTCSRPSMPPRSTNAP